MPSSLPRCFGAVLVTAAMSTAVGCRDVDVELPEDVPPAQPSAVPADTVTVLGEWLSADGSLTARAVRYEGEVWSTGIGIWEAGAAPAAEPLAVWGPEPGTDVHFESVVFEDVTGEGLADLVLLGFTEDDLAYPLLVAWTAREEALALVPIGSPGSGMPSATARERVAPVRGPGGAVCAVTIAGAPSEASHVYRWISGELRESPAGGC